jgi:nucleoside-diphosphate-sugar epimerase
MKVFITGAAGYIGHKLAHTLAARGFTVHALVRSDAGRNCLQHRNITVFNGDVLHKETLLPALEGCQQVYHAAARVGAWAKRPQDFYDVNVNGTHHVLEAAAVSGVGKMVFTSTAGIYGPADEKPVDETHQRTLPFRIDYDRSKKEAEDVVVNFCNKYLQTVIVNPAKVFGPGHTSHSLTTNALIAGFLQKGFALIPPGTYRLSFTYIDDVIQGHILAMEKGLPGERYILGGNNVSYFDFFDSIRKLAGTKGRILAVPKTVIKGWALLQEAAHTLTGSGIRFPVKSVDHLFSNYIFSSEKARQQLGYSITPLQTAIIKTIQFLQHAPIT